MLLAVPAAAAFAGACSGDGGAGEPAGTSSSGGLGGAGMGGMGQAGAGGDLFGDASSEQDHFSKPILLPGVPDNAPDLFAAPDQGAGGPCLYEPELGSLFPVNWLRPRFRFVPQAGQNLFEIKLTVPNEKSPLVIYSTEPSWTMDKSVWQTITTYGVGAPIHVTVRGAVLESGALTAGPFMGSEGDIEVAPVDAPGSVVYWTTSGGTVLKGFKIGDETVQDVLKPAQAGTQCVACHASTPDGKFVGYAARDDLALGGNSDRTDIRSVDGKASELPFLTADGKALLARPGQEGPLFSKAHWKQGDYVVVYNYLVGGKWELAWTDLAATSQAQGVGWGVFARNGDPNPAALASFSHDGSRLAYYSAPVVDAAVFANDGDIHTVDYNSRAGGDAKPLAGASDPGFNEYYPIFSPDDQLLAFNRVPAGQTSYNNPQAEVFVVPSAGGQATRLTANDPPACIGKASPGVTNSWPRWAPEKKSVGEKSYYFLVFSSTRNVTSAGPQLYVSPVVVSGGSITTYSALYLWNQPELENNHTPAWDAFELPVPN
ncbi:MAG TPA: hypothetical protein VK459_07805 [Polyangiaceae bacterium]|nr:hypothetical protein [Polyangiaceae bacterium]